MLIDSDEVYTAIEQARDYDAVMDSLNYVKYRVAKIEADTAYENVTNKYLDAIKGLREK